MPTKSHGPRALRRALAVAVTALLLTFGSLLVASPANAHDELVSADPAGDTALDALPAQLTLTFSGEIATDPGATELRVTDAAGTSLADGDPVVDGTVVTQALSGTASGAVTVLWKVVSSDGHPISGEYGFTVTATAPPTPTPTPTTTPTPTPTPTEAPTTEPTTAPTAAPVPADSSSSALPWAIAGVLLVIAVGVAVLYLAVSRARRIGAREALRADALAGPPSGAAPPFAPPSTPPADR